MNLPLDTDKTRCLAHPAGHTGRAAPTEWCHLRATCARHQTIKMDAGLGPYAVIDRACWPGDADMYIEVER